MLSAEIIAIGSELLTPERSDTNSLWLTQKLNDIGIEVKLKTIVGDDEARLEETIRDAVKRSDIVITTGGLGPTEDDLTRQVSARALNKTLEYHNDLEVHLRARFRAWGREMPEINKRQAYIIEGADILPNPNGSAVGMYLSVDGKHIAIFPGPPREMQPMFENHVFDRLKVAAGDVIVKRRVLKISGMGESAVDEAIAPIYVTYPDVQTSILFNKSEVEAHLWLRSEDSIQADATLEEIAQKIVGKLGTAVFSIQGESMEEVVGRLLKKRGETLSVAESCTGGLIGSRLTDVPGSSAYFIEGVVSYSNTAKMRTLNVPEATLQEFGAVSAETAAAMAEGMRDAAKTDHSISVTGIAGPDGGSDEKPVGTVFVGYANGGRSKTMKIVLPGDRYLIRWRASQAALDYLRRQLLKAT
ncbi:MAG: competence/damage-inducible protein A [Acidobacteria bacterium]|nr:MAG: competence/damage-inducible protein A [Acidobacteriota bacterium]